MIPVQPQPEPQNFTQRVKSPGIEFLKHTTKPSSKQWDGHEYWRRALPDMRKAYKGICTYSAQWISDNGSDSIDHFIAKSSRPDLAYEWENFRYASLKFNSRKGTHIILDPFTLMPDWFVLEFPSLLVKPNAELSPRDRVAVQHTIDVLRLNDEGCLDSRRSWIEHFYLGHFPFAHLQDMMPFVAYELRRQDMIDKIADIMYQEVQR
jgi:5-methylcytosine-specific restriction endonuclease McrA